MAQVAGVSSRTLSKIEYLNIPSAIRPNPHSAELPVPVFKSLTDPSLEISSEPSAEQDTDDDDDFTGCSQDSLQPDPLDQLSLNDLVRDLGLPKVSAELLASRLGERDLITAETKVSFHRNRAKSFFAVFSPRRRLRILP